MDFVIAEGSVPLAQADVAPSTGTPQFFTNGGDPATTNFPTRIPAYQLNAMMREMMFLIQGAGLTPDRNSVRQMYDAVAAMIAVETTARYQADSTIINQIGAVVAGSGDGDAFDITNPQQLLRGVNQIARYYARRLSAANYTVLNVSGSINPDLLGRLMPVDANGGSRAITLPPAAAFMGANAAAHMTLFRVDGNTANAVTITCASGESFNYTGTPGAPMTTTDLLPGERLELISDGVSGWFAVRTSRGRRALYGGVVGNTLTAFSWTPPVGVYRVRLRGLGGGASGGHGSSNAGGGGGGSGGGVEREVSCYPGVPITGTVGFGAPGVTSGGGTGGGTTTFNNFGLYATGGVGGNNGASAPTNNGGSGGQGYGGDLNRAGMAGNDGSLDGSAATGIGGVAPFGFSAGRSFNGGNGSGPSAGDWGGGGGGTYGANVSTTGNGGPGLAEIEPL